MLSYNEFTEKIKNFILGTSQARLTHFAKTKSIFTFDHILFIDHLEFNSYVKPLIKTHQILYGYSYSNVFSARYIGSLTQFADMGCVTCVEVEILGKKYACIDMNKCEELDLTYSLMRRKLMNTKHINWSS